MGLSNSKCGKLKTKIKNEKAPLSPRMKRDKLKNKKKWIYSKKSKLSDLKTPETQQLPDFDGITNENEMEIEVKKRMQDQLAFNSDVFVLNQMMMSVQFFANYERDLLEAVELNRKRENLKSTKLTKHCKTVLLPDRLHEAVDRRVKYVAKHGKFKNQLQPLHTQTLYIVHDNIEITNPGDTSVYSILSDAPLYKLQIDDPYEGTRKKKVLHHVGYIKLKTSEKITKNEVLNYNNLSSDSQYISESAKNDEDEDEEGCEIEIPEGFLRNKFRDSLKYGRTTNNANNNVIYDRKSADYYTPSTVSTNSTSPASSEYDYTYIRALHTHQPLNMLRRKELLANPLSTVMLPETCISNVSRFMVNNQKQEQFYSTGYSTDDDQQDDEASDFGSTKDNYYYEDKQYLNSKEFLAHFIDVFQQTFASDLGISQETLKNATWKGSAVFCDPWEIVPAISCAWPREANEWIYRQRETREDPLTQQMVQWPTLEMINKITNFGCHVIPQGYAPKLGTNPQRELEWKIVFPEAERYLESRLSPGQAKVFMITKALFKSFIDPNLERGINMFTTEHIRAHLFWQCEYNYLAFPEDHLGEALIRFLSSLLHCIKVHRLPDYFMPKRNLLQNIPEKMLVDLHKRIYRIVEGPLPYVLIAIRNLRYQRDFYPKLKYKRLYSRLVVDDPSKIINPTPVAIDMESLVTAPSDDEDKEAPLGSIAYFDRKERRSRRRRTRCVRFALDDHYVAAYSRKREVERTMRRVSVESIDTKVKVTIVKHMEILRRKLVYQLFIDQFLEMAQVSIRYRALQQTMGLLKQAERLSSLLSDDDHIAEAETYRNTIETFREAVQSLVSSSTQGPELPRRESLLDKESIRIKFRSQKPIEKPQENTTKLDDIPSDDDNDEIYNYHKSVMVQIHASSSENLARFQHTEDGDDDVDEVMEALERMEAKLTDEKLNCESESATKL